MKTIALTIVTFLWNPVLFIHYFFWARCLKYVPYKRSLFTLISANYSLPLLSYGYKQQFMQAQIIALIFEADYYADQIYRGKPGYKEKIANILVKGPIAQIAEGFLSQLSQLEDRKVMFRELNEALQCANKLDEAKISSLEEYLDIGSISISMPCLTRLVSILSAEEISDTYYLRLCSEIIRLANDYPNRQKDAKESTKNAFNIIDTNVVVKYFKDRVEEFKAYKVSGKVNKYLQRITNLGILLYKKSDFEL